MGKGAGTRGVPPLLRIIDETRIQCYTENIRSKRRGSVNMKTEQILLALEIGRCGSNFKGRFKLFYGSAKRQQFVWDCWNRRLVIRYLNEPIMECE